MPIPATTASMALWRTLGLVVWRRCSSGHVHHMLLKLLHLLLNLMILDSHVG
jgi:hypothetical protein